jgi:hypothetical protein
MDIPGFFASAHCQSEVAVGVENTNAKSVYLGDRCLTQERDLLLLGHAMLALRLAAVQLG